MSRKSNIDLTIQYIKNWFKEHIAYIVMIIIVFTIAILIYGQADKDIARALEKENRINNIEKILQEHTHYIDELEADVDNLKEVEQTKHE